MSWGFVTYLAPAPLSPNFFFKLATAAVSPVGWLVLIFMKCLMEGQVVQDPGLRPSYTGLTNLQTEDYPTLAKLCLKPWASPLSAGPCCP